MKKITSILSFMIIGISISLNSPITQAQQAHTTTSQKTIKKRSAKPASPNINHTDENLNEADIQTATATDYNCELGNKIAIYNYASDDQHIALRWKKRLHRLTRVVTSTGANRFENQPYGLVWIDIPSKGMLLDFKKGQQLANECRTPEQMAQITKN